MNDVCAIIGAGPGIGKAVARRFAREGFRVGLLARRSSELDRITTELHNEGLHVYGFPCDAERATAIEDTLDRVAADLGPISVLVYNAAVVKPGLALEVGAEQLVRELRVDVVGLLVAAQKVVPSMKEHGCGTVIATGGGLALEPWPKMTALGIGKAAIRSLALALHKELAPSGIHAATVTVNGLVEKGGSLDPDKIAEVYFELHKQPKGSFEAERVLK